MHNSSFITMKNGTVECNPLQYKFNGVEINSYFEPQPTSMLIGTENFNSDSGQFTRYTEGTQGTFTVSGGIASIIHNSGAARNDIITETSSSFSMPCIFTSIQVTSIPVQSTGYDNSGVGIIKDANNFLLASIDRYASAARIQIKINGTSTFKGSISHSWAAPFEIGLSLIGNRASFWEKIAGIWVYVLGVTITEYNFMTVGNLTDWKAGFVLASAVNCTWNFDNLYWGYSGGVGMRDQTVVTNPNGSTYVEDDRYVYFSATLPEPSGAAYCGIFKMDMLDHSYVQNSVLMVNRSNTIYPDLNAHIIKDGSDSRVIMATWANGFGGSIQILHKLESGVDLCNTPTVIASMTQLNLPGLLSGSYGAYDAMLSYDSSYGRWLIAYTITENTNFSGSPFYTALAYSYDLASWTLIGADTTNKGYEGTKLIYVNQKYWVLCGGPVGTGDLSRVYNSSMNYVGALDASFYGGTQTQPHPCVFTYKDDCYLLSYNNTMYNSGSFTWGKPTLQVSHRFLVYTYNVNPADDEFTFGSSPDTVGDRGYKSVPWSWYNEGSSTGSVSSSVLSLQGPASTTLSPRCLVQPITGNFKIRCKMRANFTLSNYASCGLFISNNSNNRGLFIGYKYSNGNNFEAFQATFPSTWGGSISGGTFSIQGGYLTQFKYFEIEVDSTKAYLRSSADGSTWTTNAEVLKSSFIIDVNRVGLFVSSENNSVVTGIFDWFRIIA